MVSRKTRDFNGYKGCEKIERRFPFLDKRVLEFCLAVPSNLKVRNGYKRYLIRAGLDGVLPPAIQWRTSKLAFSPDYQIRYNAQREQVHSFLESISATDPVREVVDVERIKSLSATDMANARAATFDDVAAMHVVPLGIYTIAFLRQFSEFRKSR
jgi:asparagine synthase (glutamine-hydrolysing)